jgi:alpha-galactosidase/6-phospho-beta-glucosidase family protein
MTTGEPNRIVANVMNHGLIDNLAAMPASRFRRSSTPAGSTPSPRSLPPQLAAYIHPAVDAQALTVRAALDEDRDAIYHAVMQDPLIQARLTSTRSGGSPTSSSPPRPNGCRLLGGAAEDTRSHWCSASRA